MLPGDASQKQFDKPKIRDVGPSCYCNRRQPKPEIGRVSAATYELL